ncbi:hypothetical protein BV25DRAFT_287555 [Artomyces pyxidatus]|uniref:Uncharacterized protein n=1 Tax=Artomyces pyxidatus TaxID=48021 RepID=A0ACB8SGJ1_9AGAM|nr:hypothetical protein BV25DRAFT_287555 [Artomyces pyxidatus]
MFAGCWGPSESHPGHTAHAVYSRLVLHQSCVDDAFEAGQHQLQVGHTDGAEGGRLTGPTVHRAFTVEISECDVEEEHVRKLWCAAGSVGEWDAGWDKQRSRYGDDEPGIEASLQVRVD